MNKIENVTVLILEGSDFTAPSRCGDMRYLRKSVQAEFDTSDIVIYAGDVVKNRHSNDAVKRPEAMTTLSTFEESENIAEQLNVLLQVIYGVQLGMHQREVLTGIALNLSQELSCFCKVGAKDEAQL